VTHLRQFSAWLVQHYSTGFEITSKGVRKFAGNSKNDIAPTFKEKKKTFAEKGCFDYENGDAPIANPENRFRIEYFKVMVNQFKFTNPVSIVCRIC
jgi:hypothetical protein